MRCRPSGWVFCVALIGLSASYLLAQDAGDSSAKSKSDTRTITGCLSKGDSTSQFELTGSDGSMWEVRSSTLPLADHVGHKISATGVVTDVTIHNFKEDAKDATADAHLKKDNSEHGRMKVTDVQMISDSCK
jgi:hypothetical protein